MPFHIRNILELLNFHGRFILDTTLSNVFDKVYEFFEYIRFSITLLFYFVCWQYDSTGYIPRDMFFYFDVWGFGVASVSVSLFISTSQAVSFIFITKKTRLLILLKLSSWFKRLIYIKTTLAKYVYND